MRCRGGSAAPAPIAYTPAAHIPPRLGIIKEMLPNFSGDPERKDLKPPKKMKYKNIGMLEFGWEQGFGCQQPHPTSNTPTHTGMLHSWPTESGFTYKRVGVMWKFYILLGRKSVSVSMYIQYVYGAAGWQCCTAQRTGWIIPAPSKDPHLRSSGHDTYSESPKLSHTPWGQQRPTRKSERNREIGGGGDVTGEEKA